MVAFAGEIEKVTSPPRDRKGYEPSALHAPIHWATTTSPYDHIPLQDIYTSTYMSLYIVYINLLSMYTCMYSIYI